MKEKKDLIVKSNRLVSAIQNLSLFETRIIQLAIIEARESGKGLSTDEPLRITVDRYKTVFDSHSNSISSQFMSSINSLFTRQFSFLDQGDLVKSRWIQRAKYIYGEGAVEIIFTYDVVNEISKLDGFETFFTSYLLEKTVDLQSVYSIRLYELLMQWKSVGKTPIFELELFRGQLGVGVTDYQAMSDFKRRVLDLAVTEISEKTDISVTYKQEKRGVKVTGFSFAFKQKAMQKAPEPTRDPDTGDLFATFSDAQRFLFAAKLSKLHEVGSNYATAGESSEDFVKRLAEMLLEERYFKKFLPLLRSLGYKPKA